MGAVCLVFVPLTG